MKAYCDTLGLTSIEKSAVVSLYEKLDKAISSASQTANKSWSNSLLDYVSSFGRDMLTYQSDKAINDLEVVKNSDINPFTLLGIVISVAVLASGAIMITGAVTGTAVLSAFMSSLLGTTLTVSNGSLALSGLVSLIAGYINSEYILKNVESDVVRENLNDINVFGMLLNIQGLVTLAINEIGNRGRDWLNKRNQDNSTIDKGTGNSQGVGNPVNIEGRGSTGRTTPNNLNEQISMHEVMSNPLDGASNTGLTMGDKRWPTSEGWQKMQRVINMSDGSKVTIHFNYSPIGELFDDFKFVYPN